VQSLKTSFNQGFREDNLIGILSFKYSFETESSKLFVLNKFVFLNLRYMSELFSTIYIFSDLDQNFIPKIMSIFQMRDFLCNSNQSEIVIFDKRKFK